MADKEAMTDKDVIQAAYEDVLKKHFTNFEQKMALVDIGQYTKKKAEDEFAYGLKIARVARDSAVTIVSAAPPKPVSAAVVA